MVTDAVTAHHPALAGGNKRRLAPASGQRPRLSRPLPALLLALTASLCHAQAGGPSPPPAVFALPPVTSLPTATLDGTPLDIATRPGWKVVYFWSGACPCVIACERYSFLPLAKKYKGKVSFFAVVSGRFDLDQSRRKLKQTIAARRLPFPVLLDPQHKVATALGARVTPQAFLLDPQGRVVFSGMPDDSRRYLDETGREGISRGYLARALAQSLAGKAVTQPQVKDQGCIIAW